MSSFSFSNLRYRMKRKARGPSIGLLFPVILLCVISTLPLLYILLRAYEVGWHEAVRLIFRPRVFELLCNTVKLAVSVTIASCAIGVSTAWCVERSQLPGRNIWNVIVTLPLAVPALVSSYTWVALSSKMATFGGAVLILTFSSYPLIYLPTVAALRGMDPALEETARSLGYGPWRTFFHVTLPLLRPALYGGALLVSLHMLAEFGALAELRYDTFTTAIFDQYRLVFNGAAAAMLTSVLIVLCLAIIGMELLVRGRARYARIGGGVSRQWRRVSLGHAKPFVLLGFSLLGLLAVVAPLGSLIYWLITGSSAGFPVKEVMEAVVATLSLGFGGSILTILFALPLVVLAVRFRGIFSTLADRIPYIIHSMPGLVIGLTFVFFSIRFITPLYQTTALLLIAYALLFLPLAQSSLRAALEQAPVRLEEVGRTLGYGRLKVFVTITLPLIFPGLGAGMALVFVEVMKELTATLLLRPTGVNTLASQVWEHTSNVEYAASAPYAALMILFAGLPVYLLTMRSFTTGKKDR
ncbi:ABC transporter permease [Peribacillus loiseleuriae]|uniref:ABC transporter permease n=1 Tax=Peribacillus loiseleuriae TaxID=1679170 RepID=UPI003D06D42E